MGISAYDSMARFLSLDADIIDCYTKQADSEPYVLLRPTTYTMK